MIHRRLVRPRRSKSGVRRRSLQLIAAVALAAAVGQPASASAFDVGGGESIGTFNYGATRIPAATSGQCASTSFTLSGSSNGFLFHTALAGYVGPVAFNGTGSATCESLSNGGGPLTLTVSGTGPLESTLQCTNLTGGWIRDGHYMSANLGGTCVINGGFTDPVNLIFRAMWEPRPVGAGVTTPINAANYSGAFTFPPA